VPWIHNVRNTNFVAAVDDEQTMQLMRLFSEDEGHACLRREGVDDTTIEVLGDVGISGLCNLVASIKAARYYDMDARDVIFTPITDSMELYLSRMQEMRETHGPYSTHLADQHYGRYLQGTTPDHVRELTYADQKALHNFKYFTWVEQQGRTSEELRQLWDEDFWREIFSQGIVDEWDRLIDAFNNNGDGG
jgi:hypothetical protein